MRAYLTAEWGKAVARPYYRIYLTVMAALAAALALIWWWTGREGMFQGSFGECLSLLIPFFSAGIYLAVIVADAVFSDQYKTGTLKNEVSYGLPRVRIYLGKLLTAAGAGLLLVFLTLLAYAVLCRLLIPVGAEDWTEIQTFLFRLLAALPLWLGALSLTMAVMFNVGQTIPIMVVVLLFLAGLGPVFRGLIGLGLDWLSALAEVLYRLTLTAPMDLGAVSLWDPAYLLWCWGVGLLWSAGSTAVGLALFARRDIH